MYLFKIVKGALDALYAKAEKRKKSSDYLDAEVRSRLNQLTSRYGQLAARSGNPIDYSDTATRIAYLYCYVAAHADFLRDALESLRMELDRNLFTQSVLRVSGIGSGPGTDVLGVLKYLHKNPEPVTAIRGRLYDRQSAWKDVRKALKSAYADHAVEASGDRLGLKTTTRSLDVRNSERWKTQGKPHHADLITLSYFVSEAYSQDEEAAARWLKKLFRRVRSDTYILYVDNASEPITNYFDSIWPKFGLERLYEYSGECLIESSEQKSELAPYDSRFSRWPKLRSDLCMQLLTKRA